MAKDYQARPDEIHHALTRGAKSSQPDGSTVHFSRHPNSPDHVITVVTRGGKVMKANVAFRPIQQEVKIKKQQEAEVKARGDRSKANQKAQLAKKRARTPKPKNK